MKAVSVVIPTYNRAERVARAVSSVLHQTFDDFELIVVDDGSKDATEQALRPYRDHIRFLSMDRNRGVSAARNAGIEASSAPLIAFLDSDDTWLPEKLTVQTAFMNQNENVWICQTEEIWIRGGVRVNPKNRHRKASGDIFERSLRRCMVSPSAVMVRRTLLESVGWFDEAFPACEDYDLWLRISCEHPIPLIDDPLVVKEGGHDDQLSARIPGLDRYRIRSMVKLLESGRLRRDQVAATIEVLSDKCRIYGNGCLKRGKEEEGKYHLGLPDRMRDLYLQGRDTEGEAD